MYLCVCAYIDEMYVYTDEMKKCMCVFMCVCIDEMKKCMCVFMCVCTLMNVRVHAR